MARDSETNREMKLSWYQKFFIALDFSFFNEAKGGCWLVVRCVSLKRKKGDGASLASGAVFCRRIFQSFEHDFYTTQNTTFLKARTAPSRTSRSVI